MIQPFFDFLRNIISPLKMWTVVAPWEQGLRVRLGKKVKTLNPGIHFKIPYLDRIFVSSTKQQTSIAKQTITLRDGRTLSLMFMITYSVKSFDLMYSNTASIDATIQSKVLGKSAQILSEIDPSQISIQLLYNKIMSEVNLKEFGLENITIHITNFIFLKPYRLITGEDWAYLRELNDSILEKK